MPECFPILGNVEKKIYLKNLATNLCNRSLTGLDEEVSCSEKMHACHIVAKHFFLAGDDSLSLSLSLSLYIYIYISTVFNLRAFFLMRVHPYVKWVI